MHRYKLIVGFFLLIVTQVNGLTNNDINNKKLIHKGNRLLEKDVFEEALSVFDQLLQADQGNANLNFKVGFCYYNLANQKTSALPYFRKATTNISDKYKFYNTGENSAPVITYFFLGETYLFINKPDSALKYFVLYQEKYNGSPPIDVSPYLQVCLETKNPVYTSVQMNINLDLSAGDSESKETEPEDKKYTAEIEKDVEDISLMETSKAVESIENMEIEKAIDVMDELETGKAVEIMGEMEMEKTVNVLEGVQIEKAVDLVDNIEFEKAVGIIEEVELGNAVDIIDGLQLEKSISIIEQISHEKATKIMDTIEVEKAADLMNGMEVEKAITLAEDMEVSKAGEVLNTIEVEKATEIVDGLQQGLDDLNSSEKSGVIELIKSFFAGQISQKKLIIFKSIYFEFNSSELLLLSKNELMILVGFMNDHPEIKIEVVGHTDIIGDWDVNLRVSSARANEVYNFLINNRISRERIIYYGKGPASPVATNNTDFGRQLNRRVEVILLQ